MKKQFLFLLSFAFLISVAFAPAHLPHVEVFKLDVNHSTLEWKAKKLTGEHYGNIKFTGGELRDNHGRVSGSFEIDMTTIVCNDLKGSSKTKLEDDLKSDNFFSVKSFPKATFAITSLAPGSENPEGSTHTISGNLTIKDKTNPVSFPTKLVVDDDGNLFFEGMATIDRSKFDIKYRSQTFFPDIGDKLIYDEFTLAFNLKLTR